MSKRSQAARGWGWLLLLGGLTACGYDVPWGDGEAAGPGSRGQEEPDIGGTPDTQSPEVKATGALEERFVKQGYGAAWTLRTGDLDNDGTKELIYGGTSVVALGVDNKPLWTFDLPDKNARLGGQKGYEQKGGQYGEGRTIDDQGQDPQLEPDREETGGEKTEGAEKLRFLGVHVREIRVTGGDLLVLDSLNRVFRINGEDGSLVWGKQLEIEGNACGFAIFDADGDDIADFFPSGGKTAYSGVTGEKLFDAKVDFVPTMVMSGDLDMNAGREIVLVKGEPMDICPAEKNALLAMEESKGKLHGDKEDDGGGSIDERPQMPEGEDGFEGEEPSGKDGSSKGEDYSGDPDLDPNMPEPGQDRDRDPNREDPNQDREDPDQDRDQDREDRDTEREGGANVYVLDAQGEILFQGGEDLQGIHSVLVVPRTEEMDAHLILGGEDGLLALDTNGENAWNVELQGVEELLLADLDGNGTEEILAHGVEENVSTLYGIGLDGEELWDASLGARAYVVQAIDVDGDDRAELLTSLGPTYEQRRDTPRQGGDEPPRDEEPREDEPRNEEPRDDQQKEQGYGEARYARSVAWTIGEQGPEELWAMDGLVPARGFAVVTGEQGNVVYQAGGDGTLYLHDAASGEVVGEWYGGSLNHAVGAGDLDGDGLAEVITGDVFGNVAITSQDGKHVGYVKLNAEGPAVVTGIAVAEGEGGNGILLVSGYAWNSPDQGILQAYGQGGETLFAVTTREGLGDVKVADLDGDGTQEIVVAKFAFRFGEEPRHGDIDESRDDDLRQPPEEGEEPPRDEGEEPRDDANRDEQGRDEQNRDEQGRDQQGRGEQGMDEMACGVLAYDLQGEELWQAPISACDISRINVGDIDGDGAFEVAYGDLGANGPYHIALIGGDGQPIFDVTTEENDAVWLEIVEGGVAFGGRSGGENGHVTLLDPNGEELWTVDAGGPAENAPPMGEDSPFGAFAGSLFGVAIGDVDGDDMRDIAFTTVQGDLQVVSSMSGEPLFQAMLADELKMRGGKNPAMGEEQGLDEEVPEEPGRGERMGGGRPASYVGGPLVYVAGERGEAGTLLVTGYDFEGMRSGVVAFDADGEAIGTMELPGFIAGVTGATFERGIDGVAIATTYDTYGVDLTMPKGTDMRPEPVQPDVEPVDETDDDGMTEE